MRAARRAVVVVGAGPAGICAALAAANAGCDVDLLDAAPRPGGQYHRRPPEPLGRAEPLRVAGAGTPPDALRVSGPGPQPRDHTHADAWLAEIAAHPHIRWWPGATVWAAQPTANGARLFLRTGAAVGEPAGNEPAAAESPRVLDARAVVLATGGYDRALPFPGWDLPGVLTVGGVQALLKGQRLLAGRRIALSGTGPFLLPVAAALAEAGAHVVGVFEAGDPRRWSRHLDAILAAPGKLREAGEYLRVLRRHRVPVRFRQAVVRAHGEHEVVGATIARLGTDFTPIPGSHRRIEVETIGVGYGFVPVLDLALALGAASWPARAGRGGARTRESAATPEGVQVDGWQATSVPGVYAAGETTGIGGAALAAAEGRLAGLAAAVHCGHLDESTAVRLGRAARRQRARYRRFAAALAAVYPVPDGWRTWLDEQTLVCRCEEVPLAAVRHALDELAITDLRTLKLVSRVGMGICQGRVCGAAVAALLRTHTGAEPPDPLRLAARPLVVPVPLAELAGLDQPDGGSEDDSPEDGTIRSARR